VRETHHTNPKRKRGSRLPNRNQPQTYLMFRFTIRDLLWLMVVALAAAWWIGSRKGARNR
jgi:hypothetical protein